MAKLTAAEKSERKLILEQKKEARRLANEKKGKEQKPKDEVQSQSAIKSQASEQTKTTAGVKQQCLLLELPEDSLHHILCFLPARDLGSATLTCREIDRMLVEGRIHFVMSRLRQPHRSLPDAVGYIDMCSSPEEAR
jgi:hypothetical protein